MKLDKKKRLAADVLGVGVNRIWIDPQMAEDVAAALTRADINRLVKEGTIVAKQKTGTSRGRTRVRELKRKEGRRRGHGSRRGGQNARTPRKRKWIQMIRPIRKRLKDLRKEGALKEGEYRRLYKMAKGGSFRNRAHLETYLKERGILKVTA